MTYPSGGECFVQPFTYIYPFVCHIISKPLSVIICHHHRKKKRLERNKLRKRQIAAKERQRIESLEARLTTLKDMSKTLRASPKKVIQDQASIPEKPLAKKATPPSSKASSDEKPSPAAVPSNAKSDKSSPTFKKQVSLDSASSGSKPSEFGKGIELGTVPPMKVSSIAIDPQDLLETSSSDLSFSDALPEEIANLQDSLPDDIWRDPLAVTQDDFGLGLDLG